MKLIKKTICLEEFTIRKSSEEVSDVVKFTNTCDGNQPVYDTFTIDYGYGGITADTIDINLFITQEFRNQGHMSDIEFIELTGVAGSNTNVDYTLLINKINDSIALGDLPSNTFFPFMSYMPIAPYTPPVLDFDLRPIEKTVSDYYTPVIDEIILSGYTDDKLTSVQGYVSTSPSTMYVPGINYNEDQLNFYTGVTALNLVIAIPDPSNFYNGVDSIEYVFDKVQTPYGFEYDSLGNVVAIVPTPGPSLPTNGIEYTTYPNIIREIDYSNCSSCGTFGFFVETPYQVETLLTSFRYLASGFKENNFSLSGLYQKEYFLGISMPPEVKDDVFIDRGEFSPLEYHNRLIEIYDTEQIENYNNGFFKINK